LFGFLETIGVEFTLDNVFFAGGAVDFWTEKPGLWILDLLKPVVVTQS